MACMCVCVCEQTLHNAVQTLADICENKETCTEQGQRNSSVCFYLNVLQTDNNADILLFQLLSVSLTESLHTTWNIIHTKQSKSTCSLLTVVTLRQNITASHSTFDKCIPSY